MLLLLTPEQEKDDKYPKEAEENSEKSYGGLLPSVSLIIIDFFLKCMNVFVFAINKSLF